MGNGIYNLKSLLLIVLLSVGSLSFADAPEDGAVKPAGDLKFSEAVIPNLIAPALEEPQAPSLLLYKPAKPKITKTTPRSAPTPQLRSVPPGSGEEVTAARGKESPSQAVNIPGLLTPVGDDFQFQDSSENPAPVETPKRTAVRTRKPSAPPAQTLPQVKYDEDGQPIPPPGYPPYPRIEDPAAPVPTPPARPVTRVKLEPKVNEPDEKTEGGYRGKECPECEARRVAAARLRKLPVKRVAGNESNSSAKREPAHEACYGQALLQTAERLQSEVVGGHSSSRSHGACAYAVGIFLKSTGFMGPGYDGHYGNAIDYFKRPGQSQGNLEKMGFVNMIGKYNKYNAPPGAVLVFGGPLTSQTGGYLPPQGRREGSAGDYVGHITVKGPGRNSYYTDGHTYEPAIANRYLKGVYVMTHCKTCTARLKQRCGG